MKFEVGSRVRLAAIPNEGHDTEFSRAGIQAGAEGTVEYNSGPMTALELMLTGLAGLELPEGTERTVVVFDDHDNPTYEEDKPFSGWAIPSGFLELVQVPVAA